MDQCLRSPIVLGVPVTNVPQLRSQPCDRLVLSKSIFVRKTDVRKAPTVLSKSDIAALSEPIKREREPLVPVAEAPALNAGGEPLVEPLASVETIDLPPPPSTPKLEIQTPPR